MVTSPNDSLVTHMIVDNQTINLGVHSNILGLLYTYDIESPRPSFHCWYWKVFLSVSGGCVSCVYSKRVSETGVYYLDPEWLGVWSRGYVTCQPRVSFRSFKEYLKLTSHVHQSVESAVNYFSLDVGIWD